MDLQNYTNVDVFRQVYEKRAVPTKDNMVAHSHEHTAASGPQQRGFNPYTNNFGTTLGK